jgi:3-dehydroquinate synthase
MMPPADPCPDAPLVVPLGERAYPIAFAGPGLDLGAFVADLAGPGRVRTLIVADPNVRPIARDVGAALRAVGIGVSPIEVPAGEASKSAQQAARLWDALVEVGADRRSLVVAVGGGVVGDLAGFAAATYARGVRLFMVPTTLLAQVDSSVGGKVGINHPRAKNIIGAFHQPIGVWIDPAHLRTLPEREYRSGLAEVVKYGVILDPDFLAWLEDAAADINARDEPTLARLIRRCCELKAGVVAADEREESGLRAILNFGHTIGHAIESALGYERGMLHGEAVAIGMVREARLATRLGWAGAEIEARIAELLRRFGLPTAMPELPETDLLAAMSRDKKNLGGAIGFVLPRAIGRIESTREAPPADIRVVLEPGD